MQNDSFIRSLKAKFSDGQMNRRQFITTAMAAGVTAASANSIASAVEAATPKMGGFLKAGFGFGATTDTLDPGQFAGDLQLCMSFSFNGYLTEVGVDGNVVPGIAESWESTPDAKKWIFKVRKGAEFHDGQTVTSTDCVASLNFHRNEKSKSSAASLLSGITDITINDKRTFTVTLDNGNADFPFTLTDYHITVAKALGDSIDWQSGIGCGAYKLDNFEPGVSVELSRYQNSWKKTYLDGAQMLTILDGNARNNAILTKGVDIIDRVEAKTAKRLSAAPEVNLIQTDGTQHFTFPMFCDVDPYDKLDVRLGLKYGINRQEMVDKILFGYGAVGNDIPLSRSQQFYNSEIPQRSYDPEKAKYYFKKAGVLGNTFKLSAADAAFSGAVDAALLIQNSMKPAGINVEVDRVPNDGYWSNVWNQVPWCASVWGGRPTADLMFTTAYKGGVSWNESHWSNNRFDELLIQARTELDDKKRGQMYGEMQQILWDDGGALIPMFASYLAAVNNSVGMLERRASNWDLDGGRWMERWWRT